MDKTHNTKSVSKSRRNLIKASAAAPVIASLHPGAAMAQSSAYQCAAGETHQDFPNVLDSHNIGHYDHDNPQTWDVVRVKVTRWEHNGFYFYEDRHNAQLFYGVGSVNGPGSAKQIHDLLSNGTLKRRHDGHIISSNFKTVYQAEEVYVLARVVQFDHSEPYIAEQEYWPKTEITRHDTLVGSCWTSINPSH